MLIIIWRKTQHLENPEMHLDRRYVIESTWADDANSLLQFHTFKMSSYNRLLRG